MANEIEFHNSETKDILAMVENAALALHVGDAKEVEVNFQRGSTSTRPEISIEIKIKR